jgi:hypothetical protein
MEQKSFIYKCVSEKSVALWPFAWQAGDVAESMVEKLL